MDRVRALMADPEFVAHIRAERVAQGLPPQIEDESFYEFLADALANPTGAQPSTPKRNRKRSAA